MNNKLYKIICGLISVVLFACSCVMPAFAETTIPGAGTEINDTPQKKWNAYFTYNDTRYNKLDVDSLIAWYMVNAKVVPPNSSIDDYNYFLTCKSTQAYGTKQMDDSYEIYCISKTATSSLIFDSENMLFDIPVGTEYYYASFGVRTTMSDGKYVISNANSFKKVTTDKSFSFFPGRFGDYKVLILQNDFEIVDKDNNTISDGLTLKSPAPFEVTYTPALSEEMSNKIYYPSKGGANADSDGMTAGENNVLKASVKLTDEYKEFLSKSGLDVYYSKASYSIIGVLSTEPITKDTNMQTFFNSSVVLYAYSDNIYKHSGFPTYDYDNDEPTGNYSNRGATIDYGLSPIYTIPYDGSVSVEWKISAIDFDTLGVSKDTTLYANIIGVNANYYSNKTSGVTYTTASTDDFLDMTDPFKIDVIQKIKTKTDDDSSSDSDRGFSSHDDPNGSSGKDNKNEKDIKIYKTYCISDPFKYAEYPVYDPLEIDNDGTKINPSTAKLKDMLNITPKYRTDNEKLTSADKNSNVMDTLKKTTPQQYQENLHNETIAKTYGDFKFDTGALTDVFTETGTFFKFLTSSIQILPKYFITILMAFFTTLLVIVLVKVIF